MHAQTVDTRPLFPPPTWPGYDARRGRCIVAIATEKWNLFIADLT